MEAQINIGLNNPHLSHRFTLPTLDVIHRVYEYHAIAQLNDLSKTPQPYRDDEEDLVKPMMKYQLNRWDAKLPNTAAHGLEA